MHRIKWFCLLFFPLALSAQNPIGPMGNYTADASTHVWKDGRLYVYGSKDVSPQYFCSQTYDVLSSSDLQHWTLTPQIFVAKDARLWAPDGMYKNGTWFLYFCLSDFTEGVATSKSPGGPFTNGKQINLYGQN